MSSTLNTDNYTIGGGELYFSATVAHENLEADVGNATLTFQTTAHNLGNVMNVEISPEVTYVDHYVSTKGKRVIDKTAATTSAINISFTFDEMNKDNLAKFFLGDLTASEISVLQNEVIEGSAHLVVDTDIGQDMTYIIPKCYLRPDGSLALNEEDWHSANMQLGVLAYSSADGSNATWLTHTFGKIDTANL